MQNRNYIEDPVRVITCFSGYDSQCMALDRIKENIPGFDYELMRWCEIEPNAIKAHNLVYPQWSDRNLGDITKVDWKKVHEEVGEVDLFTYSSPCQDFSNAGLQRGGEEGSGTRSSLLWECQKAITELRPKYLMLENVKALVSKKFLPLFLKWVGTLQDLGYKCFWKVLNAKDYGVPQNRERVFLISIREDCTPENYVFPKGRELTVFLKDVLEEKVDEKYYLSEKSVEGFKMHNENHEKKGTGFV